MESSAHLRALVESADEILLLVDAAGAILFANRAVDHVLGWCSDELVGKSVAAFAHPEDRAVAEGLFSLRPTPGAEVSFALRLRRRNEAYRTFEGRLYDLPADIGVAVCMRDVTEARALEERLRKSEAKWRLLLESANEAVLVVEEDIVVECNMAVATIFRVRRDTVVGRRIWHLPQSGGEDEGRSRDTFFEHFSAALLGTPQRFEWLGVRADNSSFDADVSMVRIEGGDHSTVVVILYGVEERPDAESELCRALDRNRALLRETHDRVVNNMRIVASLLSLQARTAGDDRLRRTLADDNRRVRAILLSEEALRELPSSPNFPAGPYVRHLSETFFAARQEALRDVSLVVDAEDVSISRDHALSLGLLLNELVANCLEHAFPPERLAMSPTPQVRVTLRCEGWTARLGVVDNGVGFPEGFLPGEGETLGMQIAETLARRMEGRISFANDGGGVAWIFFPCAGRTE